MDSDLNDTELLRALTATAYLCGNLRGSEIRVLHAITRESLMKRKHRARISFTRIGELTGLARPAASSAMKRLLGLGFVIDDEGAWRLDIDRMQAASAEP